MGQLAYENGRQSRDGITVLCSRKVPIEESNDLLSISAGNQTKHNRMGELGWLLGKTFKAEVL